MGYQHGRAWLWWYSQLPRWIPEFEYELGSPENTTFQDGVYQRRFSSGIVVSFNTHSEKGSFHVPNERARTPGW